ncbi:DNA-binding response regulator [Paraflavitalea soli]|uniref:DNA-binding response regulator n=1 Tax=Paraflavitalea soli TaxID=2315862 RepID=A0A3B7MJT1_9BACT|nr:LytTR family DNA-binding domain-containing protein [Paraflavitalea soli]AXY73887.1 DNA-binding response regulator [Paraflavitalea soli]
MKAILIDDEKNNLINLEQLLKTYCPTVEVIATAINAIEGKSALLQYHPDLVFLDIQMPGKNGFELLRELPQYDFEVIFVTAFDQYAIQAVRFAAVDYLLKPVNIEELQAAVGRATAKSRDKKKNIQLENLIQLLQGKQEDHRIALTTLKETRFIRTPEIIRCESSNNYTLFFLAGGEKLTASRPIFEYEELLKEYGFIRCHQSHLVNRKYVKSWVKEDGGYLLLDNGHQVPVSRNKKEVVAWALKA